MSEKVVVERRGHLLLIGLNRPDKLNAFDPEMIGQLARAYKELDRSRELRCGCCGRRAAISPAASTWPRSSSACPGKSSRR